MKLHPPATKPGQIRHWTSHLHLHLGISLRLESDVFCEVGVEDSAGHKAPGSQGKGLRQGDLLNKQANKKCLVVWPTYFLDHTGKNH